jgi:hypothetical protein
MITNVSYKIITKNISYHRYFFQHTHTVIYMQIHPSRYEYINTRVLRTISYTTTVARNNLTCYLL